MVGINYLLMCVLRAGFLINFLSRPVLSGFTSAASIVIIASQAKFLFGVPVPQGDSLGWEYIRDITVHVFQGHANWWHVLIGAICLVLLWVMKNIIKVIPKTKVPLPAPLILVGVSLIISYAARFEQHGIQVVGSIPSGLPVPRFLSALTWDHVTSLYLDSLIIPIVGLIETISAAKVAATKFKYDISIRQELLALGVANTLGCFFLSYTAMGAFGRTALHMNSGAQTQLTSVVSVIVVVLCLLFLTKVFYYLPTVVLASIVMFAVSSLIDVKEVHRLWLIDRVDLFLLLLTASATFALGVEWGIISAVVTSILLILYQSSRPSSYVCGQVQGTTTYTDVSLRSDIITLPGIVVFRFDAALIFTNAAYFKSRLEQIYNDQAVTVEACVIDCAGITHVDSTGVKYLFDILREHVEKEIILCFAEMR
eukprot:TRINITY_DN5447_c0_g1_i2.p1 TRINITY_DN5447_c0_g1~~TRINITY_DN5447_c0_g1_i2.p1  ORF type:complete len:438 (+),score=55.96 TRINITY_DN5447_c0_g1_i2:40-1314(+)